MLRLQELETFALSSQAQLKRDGQLNRAGQRCRKRPLDQASLISGSPEITENKLISGPFQSYFRDMGKYGKYGK
jgi:hypothetical protein